jgi:putative oxidoreductase
MKIFVLTCRILLGLTFVISGANILHPFLPMPPVPPGDSYMGHFLSATVPSGFMRSVGCFQVIGGLFVLAGAVPLGLCILCPIIVNILIYHLTIASGIWPGLGAAIIALALLYSYRGSFAGIITFKAQPTE